MTTNGGKSSRRHLEASSSLSTPSSDATSAFSLATPASLFIQVPELRQRLFQHCDLQTLATLARVKKELTNDVAQVLYEEVGYKHMKGRMSRAAVSIRFATQSRDVWSRP